MDVDEAERQIEEAEIALEWTWRIARGAYITAIVIGLLIIAGGFEFPESEYYMSAVREVGVAFVMAGAIGFILDPVARALRQAEKLERSKLRLEQHVREFKEAERQADDEPNETRASEDTS